MKECLGCLIKCYTKDEQNGDCFTLTFEEMAVMFKNPSEELLDHLLLLEGKSREDQLEAIGSILL